MLTTFSKKVCQDRLEIKLFDMALYIFVHITTYDIMKIHIIFAGELKINTYFKYMGTFAIVIVVFGIKLIS